MKTSYLIAAALVSGSFSMSVPAQENVPQPAAPSVSIPASPVAPAPAQPPQPGARPGLRPVPPAVAILPPPAADPPPIAAPAQPPGGLPAPPPAPPRAFLPPATVAQAVPPPQGQATAPLPPRQFRAPPAAGVPVAARSSETEALKNNYSVKLTVAQGEEKRECSIVTASSNIRFGAILGDPPTVPIQFSGSLTEHDDGGVLLTYSVEARFPGKPDPNQSYHSENASGQLRATLGSTYRVYTSGERIYSLSVETYQPEK